MRRLAVHQSVGNIYEDAQRNDSAGVIPRITIPVDCCMSIVYMTDTSKLRYVYVAAGSFAVQLANGYTNSGYRCRSQRERYTTAKRNKNQKQMAARNETTERSSATLVYHMITIIKLVAIS